MKKKMLIFTLLISMLFCFCACGNHNKNGGNNKDSEVSTFVFTSFTTKDYDGNIVDETIFSGFKVTMINVWGTYCPFCIEAMPTLAELNEQYRSKGFQVVGIPVNDERQNPENAESIIQNRNANYRHLRVSDDMKSFLEEVTHVPYTIFVNEEGTPIGDAYIGSKTKLEWLEIIFELLELENE